MAKAKILSISYSQVAIFDGRLKAPFNEWTAAHVAQGFSWRPKSVSFATLIADGPARLDVVTRKRFLRRKDAVRTIAVPFTVEPGMRLEVASIAHSFPIEIAAGNYRLCYETGSESGACWIRLTFLIDGPREFAVLVRDGDLDPPDPLVTTAKPG